MADALPIAWLNGEFLPLHEARISPLDRGFLFGDAVYEVIPAYGGRPLLLDAHLARLARSLAELGIVDALAPTDWAAVVTGLIERNGGGDVGVYLQVTRGADRGRDHAFPREVAPTRFAMASPGPARGPAPPVRAITLPDQRWGRCDIKATALLANVLAREAATRAGAGEALLVWDGCVTEGATSSVIVVEGGRLLRRSNGPEILPGTTTDLVVDLARSLGLECHEATLPVARLKAADEVWITSAMRGVAAVVEIDGAPVGDGRPGPVWQRVAERYEALKDG